MRQRGFDPDSAAVMIQQVRTIKNRSVGLNHVRFSLCPLWNSVESEGAQAASVFADAEAPINDSPSVQVVTSAASASYDVL